jgi:predicted ATP-dependent endonuclease of OLD family
MYSTHLPFLVDGAHLERVRTVYRAKEGSPAKTLISTDVRPTGDKDTLFPLQAALGYSLAQTLFIGKRTLIVEGITDYWIIKAVDAVIAAEGKGDSLHQDTVLIPAGGTSKLMPLASVMLASMQGAEGRMAVLLDSDTEGKQAAKRLEQAFGAEAPVLMLGTVLSRGEATIEDLVPRDVYLDALKRAGHPIELTADEKKEPMIVHACESAFERLGKGKFGIPQKTAAALVLLEDWGKNSAKVPADTKAAAKLLIVAINKHFGG